MSLPMTDVVWLKPGGGATAVGGAHAAVPPEHEAACSRWDGGGGVPDPQRFAIGCERDQIDRRLTQEPVQRGGSDPGAGCDPGVRTGRSVGGVDQHGRRHGRHAARVLIGAVSVAHDEQCVGSAGRP